MIKGAPSLNPSGRPKGAAGLAAYIAEQTEDGKELVDHLLRIVRDSDSSPRAKEAATLALLDRVAGKPVTPVAAHVMTETVNPQAQLPANWATLSDSDKLACLAELRQRALAAAR